MGIKKLWDVRKDYGGGHRWRVLGTTAVDKGGEMRGQPGLAGDRAEGAQPNYE